MLRFLVTGDESSPPDKLRRAFNKVNVQLLVEEALQVAWDNQFTTLEDEWQFFKANIIRLTDKFAPLRVIKRSGKPPWWSSKATKAQLRKRQAWRRFKKTGGHQKFLQYKVASEGAKKVQMGCRLVFENRLAKRVKKCPKAYFNYVQSKAALRATVGCVWMC